MTGKRLAAVATGLICLACGCVPRSERMAHQNVQQKRARGRQVAAVAALLKAQGREAEAARLQQQCRPRSVAPESVEQTPNSSSAHSTDGAPEFDGAQTPQRVPPVPQPPAPPELSEPSDPPEPPEPVEAAAFGQERRAATEAWSGNPPAASRGKQIAEDSRSAFAPHPASDFDSLLLPKDSSLFGDRAVPQPDDEIRGLTRWTKL